jgi:hypothetical protein
MPPGESLVAAPANTLAGETTDSRGYQPCGMFTSVLSMLSAVVMTLEFA